MNLLCIDITAIATIASPIIASIAIIVALKISKKSSEDIVNLIKSNKKYSSNQISAIRSVSINEIRQLRILFHSLLIAVIHNLEKENLEADKETQNLLDFFEELLTKFEKIKDWKIDEQSVNNINEINSHFLEMHELVDSLLSLIEQFKIIGNKTTSISKALDELKDPIQNFCKTKQ